MRNLKWKIINRFWLLIISLFGAMFISNSIYAANTQTQEETLNVIYNFADKICREIPIKGDNSNLELSGSAKIELSNLLKQLASIGAEGIGKSSKGEFSGVLQKDLASLLILNIECRKDVANKLIEKLLQNINNPSIIKEIPAQPPSSAPSRQFDPWPTTKEEVCRLNIDLKIPGKSEAEAQKAYDDCIRSPDVVINPKNFVPLRKNPKTGQWETAPDRRP